MIQCVHWVDLVTSDKKDSDTFSASNLYPDFRCVRRSFLRLVVTGSQSARDQLLFLIFFSPQGGTPLIQKLINFRAPLHIIRPFDELCAYQSHTRTSVLVTLMSDYIRNEATRIQDDSDRVASIRRLIRRNEVGLHGDERQAPSEQWTEVDRFFVD